MENKYKSKAEEVENTSNMELNVIKSYLSKLIEKEQYSKDFHIKFLLEETNKCSLTLYTKEQVEELLQEKSNIINSLCKQIQTLEKLMLDMIEINKVEELLQKQRELCYNSIYWKDDVDKDSILNAKLKI